MWLIQAIERICDRDRITRIFFMDRPARPPAELNVALPAGWDFGRDLVVLVSGRAGPVVRALRESGQARILVVHEDVDGGAAEPLPADVLRAADDAELVQRILELDGSLPNHAALPGIDPSVATAERERVAKLVGDALRSRQMQAATVDRQGPTWLLQALANAPHVAARPSIGRLRGAFAGWPCVIASPGPSLSKNVQLLPGLRGRALLLSGTHTVSVLERAGATPELVMMADPGDLLRHLEHFDPSAPEAFVVGATCRPENFGLPARRFFTFASNGALDEWLFRSLDEEAQLSTGGSVSCSALAFALALECDPIVLVGQDLAFEGERFYAEGCLDADARVVRDGAGAFEVTKPRATWDGGVDRPDGSRRFARPRPVVELPGYHGGTVPSSPAFEAFRTWFGAVATAQRGRVRIWNCTEGGASIPGMEQLPLAEAIEGWEPRTAGVGDILDERCADFEPAPRRDRLREGLSAMLVAVDPAVELSTRCIELASRAGRDPRALARLEHAEGELAAALRPLELFALYAQGEIVAAQEAARNASGLGENLRSARRVFQVVRDAAEALREPLERARDALVA